MGLGLLLSIIVGGLAGWAASRLMNAQTGLLANIALGIGGAFVLSFILGQLGIYAETAILPQFIVACAGAVLLIWIARQLRK
ncbi:MAG: GlsB/YeaQ/YmgE family stress response membrane protein [Pseudomonadota bacterium]